MVQNLRSNSALVFAAPLYQIKRGRPQQQVKAIVAGAIGNARAACLFYQSAQRLKQGGHALHFIQDNEPVQAGPQVLLDVAELVAVFRRLQIKVAPIGQRNVKGQRGFTHLAWTQKHHSGRPQQRVLEFFAFEACKHH
jgi:hypothetical protein